MPPYCTDLDGHIPSPADRPGNGTDAYTRRALLIRHFESGRSVLLTDLRVLPPEDPILRLGRVLPLGYHFFWYILCDLVSRAAPRWIGTRGSLWQAILDGFGTLGQLELVAKGRPSRTRLDKNAMDRGCVVVVYLRARHFAGERILALRRLMWHSRQWIPISNLDSSAP